MTDVMGAAHTLELDYGDDTAHIVVRCTTCDHGKCLGPYPAVATALSAQMAHRADTRRTGR